MLYKCANPTCPKLFRKMNEGRLFQLPQRWPTGSEKLRSTSGRSLEYFWLCDQCRAILTLAFRPGLGVVVVPAHTLTSKNISISHSGVRVLASNVEAGPGDLPWIA